jgi:DNA-binding Lrp family transcriptional regulator
MIQAFVLISAEPAQIANLGRDLASLEGIVEVHSVAGSGVSLLARLSVNSHEDIATIVTERIAQQPGITDTQTLISFRCYNDKDLDTMFDME